MSHHKVRKAPAGTARPKAHHPLHSDTAHPKGLSNDSKGWLIAFALLVVIVLFFTIRAAVQA